MVDKKCIPIICPKCKSTVLSKNIFQRSKKKILKCKDCDIDYYGKEGCYDFAFKDVDEKRYFEDKYFKDISSSKKLDFDELSKLWYDSYSPEAKYFLDEIKKHNVKEKIVLLLGNGGSDKELYFLSFGASIIYSDLALNPVINIKNKYALKCYKNNVTFHAFDAYNIPLGNSSIDVVYGYAFLHHIHNINCFFKEVHRILKPGGICLFLDNAYSPMMYILKWKILPVVTNFIQRCYGVSPEDEKASSKGGFRKNEIERHMDKNGFSDLVFIRFGLVYWVFKRLLGVIFNWSEKLKNIQRRFIPFLFSFDAFFSKSSNVYYNNTIKLILGFKK